MVTQELVFEPAQFTPICPTSHQQFSSNLTQLFHFPKHSPLDVTEQALAVRCMGAQFSGTSRQLGTNSVISTGHLQSRILLMKVAEAMGNKAAESSLWCWLSDVSSVRHTDLAPHATPSPCTVSTACGLDCFESTAHPWGYPDSIAI